MDISFIDVSEIPDFDLDDFTPDEIQARALKTWGIPECPEGQLVHAIMGLTGEAGELLDKVKKGLFKPGYELKPEDVKDEAGDVLYYVAVLTSLMGLTLEDLSVMNRAKLEGGGHGWEENQAVDMTVFTPQEAEDRINTAVRNQSLGSGQFDSVVMGILGGLEAYLGCEVLLEFDRNIFKACYIMSVKPKGQPELFKVEFLHGRVLDIQRK